MLDNALMGLHYFFALRTTERYPPGRCHGMNAVDSETIHRSVSEPIRTGLSWAQAWTRADRGLILCWEKGRELRCVRPDLATRAEQGELISLPWKGGIEWKLSDDKKGSLQYLAMWQGLRHGDLVVPLNKDVRMTCSRTGQVVVFAARHFGFESGESRDVHTAKP